MLNDLLESTLRSRFQLTAFRPLQREIIESLLSGTPTLAILPTGGGKSLTYQLPAVLCEGVSIVISPLLSLIEDQVQELKRKQICAERYDSTLTPEEKSSVIEAIHNGQTEILYTSPESLSAPVSYTHLTLPTKA